MRSIKYLALLLVLSVFLSGCASSLANFGTGKATIGGGYVTTTHKNLLALPPPEQKIVVAVYKFRDQSGQYKPNSNAVSFSTAVTQGATSVLIKALEDSGWFVPIERESLPNLLTERKIVRQTREGFLTEAQKKTTEILPPLMYAAILLEGGIISYDTNLVTSGVGAKYLGIGGSTQIRSDQLSIYLRAISVKNGVVIKSVYTSKTLLSRQLDFGMFAFVGYQALLEAEAGLSTNEPTHMCVLEAVEKAVFDLVVEGVLSGLWKLKDPKDMDSKAIKNYIKERKEVEVKYDKEGGVKEVKESVVKKEVIK
jgi:curli production assembly/transport component CsgG